MVLFVVYQNICRWHVPKHNTIEKIDPIQAPTHLVGDKEKDAFKATIIGDEVVVALEGIVASDQYE